MSCRELDEQLALVIAVMIDPDAALHAAPAPLVAPTPPVAPAPIAPPPAAPIAVTYVAPAYNPLRVGLHVGAVASLGLLPNPGVGLALRGRLTPRAGRRWSSGPRSGRSIKPGSGSIGATFKLVEGLVSVCPLSKATFGVELGACLGVRAGVIQSGGFGFSLVEAHERPTFGPSLEGRVRRRIAGPL